MFTAIVKDEKTREARETVEPVAGDGEEGELEREQKLRKAR
jgi:hypothetical protein